MSSHALKLYSYWRSSAAYRVRIALNLKGLDYALVPVHLVNHGGEQHLEAFRAVNPQELIPVLVDGERLIRQSLAICEYLDETYPQTAALLPSDAASRARVRALALTVACDIHPLNNLRVLQYLGDAFGADSAPQADWARHWMARGFDALESLLATDPLTGRFCHADAPTLADACLVPQMYNARRWSLDLAPYPTLRRIDAACLALDAFERARPENQPDAKKNIG
jgi:maleylacetoacetate isomerase